MTADISDMDSIVSLAKQTKVLLSTAGPYAKLGKPIVEACLRAKTHYADINGVYSNFLRPYLLF